MAKRSSGIRWRTSDEKELKRVVRNFNNNIRRRQERLINQGQRFKASLLPQKVKLQDARDQITTRKDFNSMIGSMEHFNKTGQRFKVDKNTERSLHATVRDFNAKIDRLRKEAKTQADKALLPSKISSEDLISTSVNKKALKGKIGIYKGFLEKGAEEVVELPDTKFNIKTTKWQIETMEDMRDRINEVRQKELKEWKDTEVKYGGKSAGYTQGQARMYDDDYDMFYPIKTHTYSSTYSDMREKFEVMMREDQPGYWDARTELAKINYIQKIDEVIGDSLIGKDLIAHLKSLDIKDFKRVLLSEDDLFALVYKLGETIVGGSDQTTIDELTETIWNEWRTDDMYERRDTLIEREVSRF